VTKIDESALVQEMMDAGQHNADIEKRKAGREALGAQIVNDKARTEELRAQITEWQDMILDAEERLKNSLAAIDAKETKLSTAPALPEVIETAAIAGKLNTARENNAKHTRWEADVKKYNDLDAAAKKLSNESAVLTRQIEDRTNDKAAKIAAAKLPIDGISFGEGQVLLNDLPFDQASDAEKLRTSVAIAMAANPKLLIMVESPNYSTDFTGFDKLPVRLKIEHRLVYSPHAYAFSNHAFANYEELKQAYDARAGFLLHSEPATPLWVGEFGTCQKLDCGANAEWFAQFIRYLRENNLSWSYWPLNGAQSGGESRKYDSVETYGLLSPDYAHIAAPKIVDDLRTIEAPTP